MDFSSQEKINIFKNLFRGREYVFAIHWEKADKSVSGYMPACLNEWKPGLCYKNYNDRNVKIAQTPNMLG